MHRPYGARNPDLATVNSLLSRLGLGALLPGTAETHPGRHAKCSGLTTSGRRVFVKQIRSGPGRQAAALKRSVAFQDVDVKAFSSAPLLGVDEQHGLLVYDFIEDATPADEIARDGAFGEDLAHRTGEILASLHGLGMAESMNAAEFSRQSFPPTEQLDGLSLDQLTGSSNAALQAWRLLQQDGELVDALKALSRDSRAKPPVPSHCDFRLDQLLVSGGTLHVIDWEEFRPADPARDVGSFVGEWLYLAADRAARAVHTEDDGGQPSTAGPSREEITSRTAVELGRIQPVVKAFWLEYRSHGGPVQPGMPRRVVSLAGWHLFDRMFSLATGMVTLGATQYVAHGIGRRALLGPDAFARLLGLGEWDASSR
ncbi:class V lanthionine synthetase subunit LxmK [Streptomyces sp. NPDC040724]|uniref:class V lanthionine synthetase subunit LxmK n=1 Tax=Streptomyces sp. NPDC040724 TaxID=3155612 RepID=UPI0033E9A421